jgi:hypothetical protein
VIPRGGDVQTGDPELQELYQELPDVQPIQDFSPPPAGEGAAAGDGSDEPTE